MSTFNLSISEMVFLQVIQEDLWYMVDTGLDFVIFHFLLTLDKIESFYYFENMCLRSEYSQNTHPLKKSLM